MVIATLALAAAGAAVLANANGNLPGLAPGATVRLDAAPYDLIEIKNAVFEPAVTIDAGTTEVRGLRIINSKGIIWRGGVISSPAGRDGHGPSVYGGDLRRVTDVQFDGTRFTNAYRGMVVADSNGIVIRNAHFTGLRSDGLNLAGTSHILLENNRFDDFTPVKPTGSKTDGTWKDGDHPDAIQLWTTPTSRRVTDITIRGNRVNGDMQGINFFGPKGDGYGGVTITGNTVDITYPAAISVFACDECTIRDNQVAAIPGSRFKANIRFEQSTGTACGNRLANLPNHFAAKAC